MKPNRLQLAIYICVVALGAGLLYWQSEGVRDAIDPINPFYERPKGGGQQSSPDQGRQRPGAATGPRPRSHNLTRSRSPTRRPGRGRR
jgi:hypothetical protein